MTEKENYIQKISKNSGGLATTIGLYLIRKGEQRDETADQNQSGKDATIYSARIDDFREATLEMTLSVPKAEKKADDEHYNLENVPLEIKTHPRSPGNSTIANESVDWGLNGHPDQYRVSCGESTVMEYSPKMNKQDYSGNFKSQVVRDYTRLLQDIILHLTMAVPKGEPKVAQEEPKDLPKEE